MSLRISGEDLAAQQVVPSASTEVRFPTPTETDLYDMYAEKGLVRFGIIALIVRETEAGDAEVLLMPHKGSEKARHGALGAPGETSLVYTDPVTGEMGVEPIGRTLRRCFLEEIGFTVSPSDLRIPKTGGYFDTTWPVGASFLGQFASARCPIVFVEPDLADRIEQAGPTDEILGGRKFYEVETALSLADTTNNPDALVRGGLHIWLHNAQQALAVAAASPLAPLASEPWLHDTRHTRDAIMTDFWNV